MLTFIELLHGWCC